MLKHLLQHLDAPRNEGMQQVRTALEQFQVRLLIVDDADFPVSSWRASSCSQGNQTAPFCS
jgi:hypothetical protein